MLYFINFHISYMFLIAGSSSSSKFEGFFGRGKIRHCSKGKVLIEG